MMERDGTRPTRLRLRGQRRMERVGLQSTARRQRQPARRCSRPGTPVRVDDRATHHRQFPGMLGLMDEVDRAERAADPADRRARDADRISRWIVGTALAVPAVILSAVVALAYQVAGLSAAVDALAAAVESLSE